MSKRWLVPVGLAAAALIATGCGSSSSSGTSTGSGSGGSAGSGSTASIVVKTTMIGGATVLTNAKGFKPYWFVPDTSTKSNCNGQCAKFWPPLKARLPPALATGTLGTITRSNGTMQATWNGHPLYTFLSDKKPGKNSGNGLNSSGGLWHEVTVSGAAAPWASSSKSKSSGRRHRRLTRILRQRGDPGSTRPGGLHVSGSKASSPERHAVSE